MKDMYNFCRVIDAYIEYLADIGEIHYYQMDVCNSRHIEGARLKIWLSEKDMFWYDIHYVDSKSKFDRNMQIIVDNIERRFKEYERNNNN